MARARSEHYELSDAERKRLARDYAAGRDDAREILETWEAGQLELLEDEGS